MVKEPMYVMRTHIQKKLLFKMKNKHGLSAVIATLMLILLTLVIVGILWAALGGLLEPIDESKKCFNLFDKITLDESYTCYNGSGLGKSLMFSIDVDDVDLDEVIIVITSAGSSNSYTIKKDAQIISNIKPYNKSYSDPVRSPGENSQRTYVLNTDAEGITTRPESIEIAPVIEGKQCEVSDSITEIVYCTALF